MPGLDTPTAGSLLTDSRLTTTATRLTEMPRQRWQVMATYSSQPLRRQLAFGTDPMISSGSILR
jgi:hypothetical protein